MLLLSILPLLISIFQPITEILFLLRKQLFINYCVILRDITEKKRLEQRLLEQNAKLALNVAPHAYVMETGRIVMDDSSEKLAQNEDIKDFYLGLTDKGGKKSFRDVKHYRRRKRWLA